LTIYSTISSTKAKMMISSTKAKMMISSTKDNICAVGGQDESFQKRKKRRRSVLAQTQHYHHLLDHHQFLKRRRSPTPTYTPRSWSCPDLHLIPEVSALFFDRPSLPATPPPLPIATSAPISDLIETRHTHSLLHQWLSSKLSSQPPDYRPPLSSLENMRHVNSLLIVQWHNKYK
jgi:hypothetical protein